MRTRHEEEVARRCIQAALDDVEVVCHDDQSQDGMYDLEIRHAGNQVAAVEVTQVLDAEPAVAWNMLNSGGRWIEPGLVGGWAVGLRPDVRVKPLKAELPEFLRALEEAGIQAVAVRSSARGPFEQRAEELGIIRASQSDTAFTGSIYPMPEQTFEKTTGFAADDGNALTEWVGEWLRQPVRSDNLTKLMRSGMDGRHMFIIFPSMADVGFEVTELFMRSDAPLPTVPPDLPPEITHVWTASVWGRSGMRWSPEAGWERFATQTDWRRRPIRQAEPRLVRVPPFPITRSRFDAVRSVWHTTSPNTCSDKGAIVELSPRQREILEFVNTHVDEQGYPPTVREIGQAVGLTSPSTVHAHLARLESSGLIRRDPTKPRALEVIEGGRSRDRVPAAVAAAPHSNVLPLLGDVAAGTGLVADEAVEDMVAVPDQLCSDADFLLTVKGDSMINAGILDGDFVVVRKQEDARNGEIVVALMGDEDATVKRFFRESGRVRLQPENDDMEPMYPDQVTILGTVRAVLRRL